MSMPIPPGFEPEEPKFGDKPKGHTARMLIPGASFPEMEVFRQTNGPLFLTRMKYNGCHISGTGPTEVEAVEAARQFYMNETAQGQRDSVEV